MHIDFLIERFETHAASDAIVWKDKVFSYAWLNERIQQWLDRIDQHPGLAGSVVSLQSDFSPDAIALLLALVERSAIVVPLTDSFMTKRREFCAVAQVEYQIVPDQSGTASMERTAQTATHQLFAQLKAVRHPGLVLFSSGSTGKSKAAVHDFLPLLEKFRPTRHPRRMLAFLLFDHIGGLNTLFYALSNGGCLITVEERLPDVVCRTIEKHRVEILPTSPSFLNLLLLSEAYKRYDLSSLRTLSYGTEVMPEATLRRIAQVLPGVDLLQTYGLSEVGILRSRSKASDSLLVQVGGEGFETRVVDGMLEIQAKSAMLGYLNAPNPFTEDGWFRTGDAVEVDGDYIRILGRKSDIINIGGEKVYPAEVENVLLQMEGIEDASVSGEQNSILGQIISARVKLSTEESLSEFRKRMHDFCRDRLPLRKIPQKVILTTQSLQGQRLKKTRISAPEE